MAVDRDAEPDLGESVRGARRRLFVPFLVGLGVVVADQITKRWAVSALDDRDIDLVGSLRFHLVENTGMAFSRAQGLGGWIGVLAIVLVIGLVVVMRRTPDLRTSIPLALIAGGAIGNLADRLFRGDGILDGAVIDFVDLQWWPVFNIADMGVVVGGAVLLLFGRRPAAS